MRTVYMGTSPFAVTVLERLAAGEHRPQLVVTRPDRPRGRGQKRTPPPVAEAARALGLELSQPGDVNAEGARAQIADARPEVVCICAFGAFLREPLLSDHELLNVHPSLLPRWRGAAPIERAIDAGDERTGVSIMRPIAELDAGPVCLAGEEPIRPDDDFGSLEPRLAELGAGLLVEALDTRPPCAEQPEEGVTPAPKIEAGERRLDPARSPLELARRVRALTPHIGAWIPLGDADRLGVRAAVPVAESAVARPVAEPQPGQLTTDGERLLYGCAGGALELLAVQPAGGRPMDAAAWLRGHGAALAASS